MIVAAGPNACGRLHREEVISRVVELSVIRMDQDCGEERVRAKEDHP
jgi:hypothetical protein